MTVPGYSAEASLYQSTGQYRAMLVAGLSPSAAVAIPQQSVFCFPRICPIDGFQTCCICVDPLGCRCYPRHCRPRILAPVGI